MIKQSKAFTIIIVCIALVFGSFYIYQHNQASKEMKCDEIVAEFMERSKSDPLNEITAPVAKCMETKSGN